MNCGNPMPSRRHFQMARRIDKIQRISKKINIILAKHCEITCLKNGKRKFKYKWKLFPVVPWEAPVPKIHAFPSVHQFRSLFEDNDSVCLIIEGDSCLPLWS